MDRHKPGHFSWIDLTAKDVEAQSRFYENLFGWTYRDEPTDMGPPYRMFMRDGKDVTGVGPMPPDMEAAGMPPMWSTYIGVDDADAVIAKAAELGGQVTMPLMEVPDFGRMVGISDPTGATVFFWQPTGYPGAAVYGVHGSLVWNDLNTRDLAAAADFYEALLGWEVDRSGENDPDYWSISIDGQPEGGMMFMGEQFPAEVPAHWLVYFAVDDARATVEKAVELGGRAEMEPMEIPVCVFCVLSDPAGATFAIMQMKER
jgi:predicted enzyme related to lactoylglutathione lyase